MNYNAPLFTLTPQILQKERQVIYLLGQLEGVKLTPASFKLRKKSKIQTIHSSLAIEGNRLTIEQITALLNGKLILGPQKDIWEASNAIKVYDNLKKWNALSLESLLKAHKILMCELITESGQFRSKGVGVFKGEEVQHIAPPASLVPQLMENLFIFLSKDKYTSWLIKGCVFHFEFEFIHPFSDGNGRIGRLWQQLILMKENLIFEHVSVEAMIKNTQKKYYDVLNQCSKSGDCTLFIEYSLDQILATLKKYLKENQQNRKMTVDEKLQYAKEKFKSSFKRKDYMEIFQNISSSTATRDLEYGVKNNILQRKGNDNLTEYKFI